MLILSLLLCISIVIECQNMYKICTWFGQFLENHVQKLYMICNLNKGGGDNQYVGTI